MPRINTGTASTPDYYISQLGQNHSVLSPLLAEEASKSTQHQLLHLLSFQVPDTDSTTIYWADTNYDVMYNGTCYIKFPFKFDGVDVNTDGTIEKTSISVANVNGFIMRYVESYGGLRGCRVKIKTLYSNALDDLYGVGTSGTYEPLGPNPEADPTAYIEDEYLIDSYTATEQVVTFQLDPVIDLQIMVPRRRYMVDTCYWPYRAPALCKFKPMYIADGTNVITLAGNSYDTLTSEKAPFVKAGETFASVMDPTTVYTIMSINGTQATVSAPVPTTSGTQVECVFTNYTTCDMTFAACRERNNEENFGGFPGISGSRRLYL